MNSVEIRRKLLFLATLNLIALGGFVSLGTFIPQGLSYVAYIEKFGLSGANFIQMTGLDDVYHHAVLWILSVILGLLLLFYSASLVFRMKRNRKNIGKMVFHFAIVLVLIASAIIFVTGKEEKLELGMGEKIQSEVLSPVTIALNRFDVAFYSDGLPKQYYANISFSDGQSSFTKDIKVNEPFFYKGYAVYQDSYAWESLGVIEKGKEKKPFRLRLGETIDVDSGVVDTLFLPSYDEKTKKVGQPKPTSPHLLVRFQKNDEKIEKVIALGESVTLGQNKLTFTEFRPYAGLYLKYKKGLGLLKLGYGLLVLGIFMNCYAFLKRGLKWK